MKTDKFPGGVLHKLLTFFSFIVLAMCVWKFFGPGSLQARSGGARFLSGTFLSGFGKMFSVSIAVVCFGYLLWRFMTFIFWYKYFKDKPMPPEDDEDK